MLLTWSTVFVSTVFVSVSYQEINSEHTLFSIMTDIDG
jgi:hypothetical protein